MPAPDSHRLYTVAAAQEGFFTTRQAAEAGYSRPLIDHHVRAKRFLRVRRGIYRLVHFPYSENPDLVVAWLWSATVGVASHETALALHRLSDVLPAKIHLTVPATWRKRRIAVPDLYVLHYSDLAAGEKAWSGAVPMTAPLRTIRDCLRDGLSPDLIHQAVSEGMRRGLFTPEEVASGGEEP
jgi:predicted transcriptional regulator of viral defense system